MPVDHISSEVDRNWWDFAESRIDVWKLITVFSCGAVFMAITPHLPTIEIHG